MPIGLQTVYGDDNISKVKLMRDGTGNAFVSWINNEQLWTRRFIDKNKNWASPEQKSSPQGKIQRSSNYTFFVESNGSANLGWIEEDGAGIQNYRMRFFE